MELDNTFSKQKPKVELYEMARVGIMNEYEIFVNTDDSGRIPHFHIWDYSTKGNKFHTCIKITKPEYFHHTGKEGILNTKMKKELVKFMQAAPKNKNFNTNWELIIAMWNLNNSIEEIDEQQPMPNYLLL